MGFKHQVELRGALCQEAWEVRSTFSPPVRKVDSPSKGEDLSPATQLGPGAPRPMNAMPRPRLPEWTTSDVCDWASGLLNLPPETIQLLRKNEVDGAVLPTLTEASMEKLGIHQLGFRRRLLLGVADLVCDTAAIGAPEVATADRVTELKGNRSSSPLSTGSKPRATLPSTASAPRSSSPQPKGARHLSIPGQPPSAEAKSTPIVQRDSAGCSVGGEELVDIAESTRCGGAAVAIQSSRPPVGTVQKLLGKIQEVQKAQEVWQAEQTTRSPRTQAALVESHSPAPHSELHSEEVEEESAVQKPAVRMSGKSVESHKAEEALWYSMFDPFELESKPQKAKSRDQAEATEPEPAIVKSLRLGGSVFDMDVQEAMFFDPLDLEDDGIGIAPTVTVSPPKRRTQHGEEDEDGDEMWRMTSIQTTPSGCVSQAMSEFWQDVSASSAKTRDPHLRLSLSSARVKLKAEEAEESEEEEELDMLPELSEAFVRLAEERKQRTAVRTSAASSAPLVTSLLTEELIREHNRPSSSHGEEQVGAA